MKQTILLLALTILLTALPSCSVLHVSDNDDLDGFWMLTEVDTLATAGNLQMREQRVFWSFQGYLMQTQWLSHNAKDAFVYRFAHNEDKLVVSSPCLYNRVDGDQPISEVDTLRPMGINDVEESFKIERLDRKRMTLNDGVLRLYFEKY